MEILFTNPFLTLLIICILYIVGDKLFLKKDEKSKLEKDVNAISNKTDSGLNLVKQEFIGAIHNHELKNKDEFTLHQDKFYKELDRLSDKIEQKYVSKEIQKQQDDRMNKFENRLESMECMLSEVKTTGDINASKLDSVVDMIEALSNKIDKINKI